jgi:hypothetical protein
MAFFEDSTVTETIDKTIKRVERLEEEEQKKLLKVFQRVRRELQDRLLTIPPGTFSEQQANVTLVQVTAAIEAIKRDLRGQMVESSEILANRGISDLVEEIEKFQKEFEGIVQPIPIDRVVVATETNRFLLNKYQASIDAYGEGLRSQITSSIVTGLAARDTTERTVERLVADVGRFFIGEEWKLRRIARTELHNVYNFSKLRGMQTIAQETVPDLKKALVHPIDGRTGEDSMELARKNPVVDIDQPFRFKWKGDTRVFMFPPDRPNDRAIMIPYRKAWD